jgi:hypothetical protein
MSGGPTIHRMRENGVGPTFDEEFINRPKAIAVDWGHKPNNTDSYRHKSEQRIHDGV